MAKGQQFERDICRQLSLWFSKGKHDDWFWRTAGSGARATVRGKKGKKTTGQHGDIAATDPRGIPLLNFFCFELKRGYSKATLHDLLDSPKKSIWKEWITKARKNSDASGSDTWAIIHKRDRKEPIIVSPLIGKEGISVVLNGRIFYALSLRQFLKNTPDHYGATHNEQ